MKRKTIIVVTLVLMVILAGSGLIYMKVRDTNEIRTPPSTRVPKTPAMGTSKGEMIRKSVESQLFGEPPRGYESIPEGVKLLDVRIDEITEPKRVILDFSHELLSKGTGYALEDALHQIIVKVGNENIWLGDVEYRILVDGRPIRYE